MRKVKKLALLSIKEANKIDSESPYFELLLEVMRARNSIKTSGSVAIENDIGNASGSLSRLFTFCRGSRTNLLRSYII